jgi:hypothetical protein
MSIDESIDEEYFPTFNEHEKSLLKKSHVPPRFANLLAERSSVEDIKGLFEAKIPVKKPGIFGCKVHGKLRKITPDDIQRYDKRFSASDLFQLMSYGIKPSKAVKYPHRFTGREIANFISTRVSPQDSSNFHHKFDSSDIIDFVQHHIPPEKTEGYNPRFSGHQIMNFINCSISPESVERYNSELGGYSICVLNRFNFSPEDVKQGDEELLIHMAKTVVELIYEYEDTFFDRFSYLTTGNQSYLVRVCNVNGYGAWKFSRTAKHEKSLFYLLRECHGKTLSVVNVSKLSTKYAIELEYLKGETIDSKVTKEIITSEKTQIYGFNIFNGLQELRQAGIYQHRDIRPANIMIDEKDDRAVIIDLGIATTDILAPPKDNRRYGGPNDLVSLGQVMYKMATSEHIFADSKSMERTIFADKLKDHRDWIYEGDQRLEPYLRKVEETIKDKNIAEIIKLCLTAKGIDQDYQLLEERFGSYEN